MFFEQKKDRKLKFKSLIFLPVFTFLIVTFLYFYSQSYSNPDNFNWSEIRNEVKDSVLKIKRFGTIITSISEDDNYLRQMKTQGWIRKNTTTSELLKIIEYPDPNIKALSYDALLRKKEIDKYHFLRKSLTDSLSFVQLAGGCLGYEMHLSEYLLKHQFRFGLERFPNETKIEDELTLEQVKEIDSLYKNLKFNEEKYLKYVYGEEIPVIYN